MSGLVTLGAAPYNPYNDTFGRFAMQGLQMGMQMIQHKDQLHQRQVEHQSSLISEGVQNLFKGQEMNMRNKELNHRIENDLFNRILDEKKFEFSKTAHADEVGLRGRDISLREKGFEFEQDKWRDYGAPHQVEVTKALADQNKFNDNTWNSRVAIANMQVNKEALGLTAAAQAITAGNQAVSFADKTEAARVASTLLAPTKTALEVSQAASEMMFMTPERREEMYQTKKKLDEAETKYKNDRALYYASGGAAKDEILARGVEAKDALSTQSMAQKLYSDAEKEANAARGMIATYETSIKSGKLKGTKQEEQIKNELKGEEDKLKAAENKLKDAEIKLDLAQTASTMILKLHNKMLIDRGKTPLATEGLTPAQKARLALEVYSSVYNEQAGDTGKFPGSSNPYATPNDPYATPAEKAAFDRAAGKPIATPSNNPPQADVDEAAVPQDED